MTVKEAVVARFNAILTERRMRANELATRSGVTPSSVYSMLDPRRKEVSVNLVKKLCDGLDMSLGEFFADSVFDELEQEIQQLGFVRRVLGNGLSSDQTQMERTGSTSLPVHIYSDDSWNIAFYFTMALTSSADNFCAGSVVVVLR